MNIKCKDIQCVINIVKQEGNTIKEVQNGWSETEEVIVMNKGINKDTKEAIIKKLPGLEYWSFDGSPLDPPDEGFACKKCSVAISFPRPTRYQR